MAKVDKYKNGRESITSVWSDNGDKRYGFVSKEPSYSDPAKTRYGIGIDNVGSPYRGIYDNDINTPLGNFDYGYDGDTIGAGFTPNIYGGSYKGDKAASFWGGIGDAQIRGSYFSPELTGGAPVYGLGIHGGGEFPEGYEGYYNEVNTPLGTLGYGTSDTYPSFGASFEPNAQTNYYLQALANLLNRGR